MTPLEIFEYKQRWKPGYAVPLHSDWVDAGKTWCRRQLSRETWSMTEWTGAYEHTFHFEDAGAAQSFAVEFSNWVNR